MKPHTASRAGESFRHDNYSARGVGPDICKAGPFNGNGSVSYGRGNERDALDVVRREGGPELGVEHGQGDGAGRKMAFPGALREKPEERMNSWEGNAFPLKKCFIFVSFLPDITNCNKLLERRNGKIKTFLYAWQPAQTFHMGHLMSQDPHLPRPDRASAPDFPKGGGRLLA
ncbi:hypothetical protein EYF80_026777 [Liparis tanakae]|uniref:Uncharacterized protein n=1 Tax=Liparis tanakae TaxID=230148 RepID=A0A4Z2HAR0_9TELE|nr:hypothetical protein EYF80_026777 [Liparis tanakae]